MAQDPYTIQIFVRDGDPEGIRVIEQMNWTGRGIVFPREKWAEAKTIPDLEYPGVYVLVGFDEENDDLPRLYIGEGDGVVQRIDSHAKSKDFWTWGIAFVSSNRGLNKAHVQWLEYALVSQASAAKRCMLDNGNSPQAPALSDRERADTKVFLKEILRILPLAGLRAFEMPKAVVEPRPAAVSAPKTGVLDTIVVPAQKEGFEKVFLGENCWYAIRLAGGKIPDIKWIAAYQSLPISAITHLAPVARIEPYGEGGKYRVVFGEPARAIAKIPFGNAPGGYMQGLRYTTLEKLKSARTVMDIS